MGDKYIKALPQIPDISGKEDKSNKVQNLNSPNSTTYPSTNAVKNALNGKVSSVTGVSGVPVDNTDPSNPIIGLQDRLPIEDITIDDTEPPQWYFDNFPYSTTKELKRISEIDLNPIFSTGTFCTVETITQWDDDSRGYPYQIATNPADGKIAKRYGISDMHWSDWEEIGGSMTITPITYSDLKTLKTNNSLEQGVRYYITDRDIWIDALGTDKLSMNAKRHFRVVKDEYYTPHDVTSGIGTQRFLGIYGQTYNRGSTPYSSNAIGGTTYYAIWGGRMWVRQNNFTGGPDVPGTSDATIAGGWNLRTITSDIYYESKIFDIKYDFDNDLIWEQSDDRGNIIKRLNSTTSYIDITDWGNVLIYNNECYGIFNNFRNVSTKATIYNNSNIGYIGNNSNNGTIYNNSNSGNIYANSSSGPIEYNSNNGNINNNLNTGWIQYNSNAGNINNNSNRGSIVYNSNNGNINNNTSSGSTNFNIANNLNNGHIQRNNSTSTIDIMYNINNGNIGSTGTTNRSSNVQDTRVNK